MGLRQSKSSWSNDAKHGQRDVLNSRGIPSINCSGQLCTESPFPVWHQYWIIGGGVRYFGKTGKSFSWSLLLHHTNIATRLWVAQCRQGPFSPDQYSSHAVGSVFEDHAQLWSPVHNFSYLFNMYCLYFAIVWTHCEHPENWKNAVCPSINQHLVSLLTLSASHLKCTKY